MRFWVKSCYAEAMDNAVSKDLRTLMHNAGRNLRRTWSAQLEPWGLTPFQWRALRTIAAHDEGLRPGEVASQLRIAPRSATEVIDQLEAKELVQRGPDPADRRATRVRLTPRGSATAQDILAERDVHSSEYFAPLTASEQAELARLLGKLGGDTAPLRP